MKTEETKPKTLLELQLQAMAKKRFRLTPWMRAYALVMGVPLRKRGRPKKKTTP